MIRNYGVIVVVVCVWITVGCVPLVLGIGAGVGTYAYVEGELKRTYSAEYDKTLKACTGILADLNMPILEKTTDGLETTIETKRSDGTPMNIKVGIIDLRTTEVSVRTGAVGFWKRDISKQFHEFIEERLQR